MTIIHRYLLKHLLRNFFVSLLAFTFLFVVFDFFDRFDNLLAENASFGTSVLYFLLKMPLTINLMLPVAMLVSTLFTIGMLSKQSEITAMRAAGLPILWLAKPILAFAFVLSLLSLVMGETLVPYTQRRVREIYNIDIKKNHLKGAYSQTDFWWRSGKRFNSADMFDSRTNSLLDFSSFDLDENYRVTKRTDASQVDWVNPTLKWTMKGVSEYKFGPNQTVETKKFNALPLLLDEKPEDFYETKTDVSTMSYRRLSKYLKQQRANGIPVTGYKTELYAKFSFPFIIFIVTLVILPFSLKPARSGSLAMSFIAGLIIAFSYYAVHSFSIAMGHAELWPPLLAAWMANLVMCVVGLILNLGAEAPA
ncbi:MAG: LPS export ABC transporter permease LptG [Deltaproteobacteria bacterium]|nr:LPS export ABC transporter permease LptG [Deltaproteobacteria bacterium]